MGYSSLNPTIIPVTITSATPQSGSMSGGTIVTITGTGFAYFLGMPGFAVTVGGTPVTPTSVNN